MEGRRRIVVSPQARLFLELGATDPLRAVTDPDVELVEARSWEDMERQLVEGGVSLVVLADPAHESADDFYGRIRGQEDFDRVPVVTLSPDAPLLGQTGVATTASNERPFSRDQMAALVAPAIRIAARRAHRVDAHLPATVAPAAKPSGLISSETSNISAHGFCLVTAALAPATETLVTLDLPTAFGAVDSSAIVRWSSQAKGTGFEFRHMSPEAAARLEAFLKKPSHR